MGLTYNNDEHTFGIAIFEAEDDSVRLTERENRNERDESAAQKIMANDPAVMGGVMRAKLYPYKIALMRK